MTLQFDDLIFKQLTKEEQEIIDKKTESSTLEDPLFFDTDFLKKRGAGINTQYTFENSLGKPAEVPPEYKSNMIIPSYEKQENAGILKKALAAATKLLGSESTPKLIEPPISEVPNNLGSHSYFILEKSLNPNLNYKDVLLKCQQPIKGLSAKEYLEQQNILIAKYEYNILNILNEINALLRLVDEENMENYKEPVKGGPTTIEEAGFPLISYIKEKEKVIKEKKAELSEINRYIAEYNSFIEYITDLLQEKLIKEQELTTGSSFFSKIKSLFKDKKIKETEREEQAKITRNIALINSSLKEFATKLIQNANIIHGNYRNIEFEIKVAKILDIKKKPKPINKDQKDQKIILEEEIKELEKDLNENYARLQKKTLPQIIEFINKNMKTYTFRPSTKNLDKDMLQQLLFTTLIKFPYFFNINDYSEYENTIKYSKNISIEVPEFDSYVFKVFEKIQEN